MQISNRKNLISFSKLLTVVILAAVTFEGVSMSLFTKPEEEVVLFSEMEGHIIFNGQPVKNAKIERRVNWKDEVGDTDYFNTNDEGYFYLPEIKLNLKLNKFSQFVVGQEVKVIYDGEEHFIWVMGKMSKSKYGELGGAPVNLRCDLKDESVRVEVDNGLLGTSCKWDAIKE